MPRLFAYLRWSSPRLHTPHVQEWRWLDHLSVTGTAVNPRGRQSRCPGCRSQGLPRAYTGYRYLEGIEVGGIETMDKQWCIYLYTKRTRKHIGSQLRSKGRKREKYDSTIATNAVASRIHKTSLTKFWLCVMEVFLLYTGNGYSYLHHFIDEK